MLATFEGSRRLCTPDSSDMFTVQDAPTNVDECRVGQWLPQLLKARGYLWDPSARSWIATEKSLRENRFSGCGRHIETVRSWWTLTTCSYPPKAEPPKVPPAYSANGRRNNRS
jgi:hypothetical protein